jgi:hypothetical protein
MIVEVSKEESQELLDKAARFLAERRMGSPAIMFIESVRPLHFLASQFLYAIAPFAELIFSATEYQKFACSLEKEENVAYLLEQIDRYDIEFHEKLKEEKKKIKELKKKKKALKKI